MKNVTTEEPLVEIRNVSKQFASDTLALQDINLTIQRGQTVTLLGHSGAGKSTLLRHVNGLEQPSSGTVRVLGKHVNSLSQRELRELRTHIGMIFQQFELVGSLTSLENVLTGALGRVRGPRLGLSTYGKRLTRKALDLLDEVGMIGNAYQRASTLSGGQQQRVAIARALMQEPQLLLADEPVASLDPEASRQIMALLSRIGVDHHLTVVCSLHQVELALEWSDRVIGMRDGKILLDSPSPQLTAASLHGLYRQERRFSERTPETAR
jgi:phosphonate transport system ATP-binding protein